MPLQAVLPLMHRPWHPTRLWPTFAQTWWDPWGGHGTGWSRGSIFRLPTCCALLCCLLGAFSLSLHEQSLHTAAAATTTICTHAYKCVRHPTPCTP